jgi:hypothetical protein
LSFTLLTRPTLPVGHQTNPPNPFYTHRGSPTRTRSKAMTGSRHHCCAFPIRHQSCRTPISTLALLIPTTSGGGGASGQPSPEPPQIERILSSCARAYLPGRLRPRHVRRRPERTATPAAAAAAPRLGRRGLGDPWRPSVTRSRRAGTASGAPRIRDGDEGCRGSFWNTDRWALVGGGADGGGDEEEWEIERRWERRGVGWDATRETK